MDMVKEQIKIDKERVKRNDKRIVELIECNIDKILENYSNVQMKEVKELLEDNKKVLENIKKCQEFKK